MRPVFVTGTGTETGKTVVAASIAAAGAERGLRVGVFKPAVTGLDEWAGPAAPSQPPDDELLRAAAGSHQTADQVAPYRYGQPASPHLAAALAGGQIEPERLRVAARVAAEGRDLLVCEGVGGLMVPLTSGYLVRDLALDVDCALVIAARPGLGTINHTLLTLESARAAGLAVAGVVMTPWPQRPDAVERDNRATVERLGRVEVAALPTLPERALAEPSPAALGPAAERALPLDRWLG